MGLETGIGGAYANIAPALPQDPVTMAGVGSIVLGSRVAGDTVDRFTIAADGTLSWGPGNGATDSVLTRLGAGFIGSFTDIGARSGVSTRVIIGNGGPAGQSGVQFQNGEAGSNLYRLSAGFLKCDGTLWGAAAVSFGPSAAAWGGGTQAGAANAAGTLSYGSGAPVNAVGANGDLYFRQDGGAGTTIYQRRAGAWVGIV